MIVFVGGDDEQCIVLSDPVLGEPGKKLAEGFVISFELRQIPGFTGTEGLLDCRADARESGSAIVVGVGNVAIDYRYARSSIVAR